MQLPDGTEATWRSESDEQAPESVVEVDDRLTADVALSRVRRGEWLWYRGDFRNARQLLTAMQRRLEKHERKLPADLAEAFRVERRERLKEHQTLGHVLVHLDSKYQLDLKHAPNVREACEGAWGKSGGEPSMVSLKTLLGMMGAAEWRKKGLEVPGLRGKIHPHYGVFSPTRNEYVKLLLDAPKPEGKTVIELGTGTGVLSFVLLARGAKSARATDLDPRAVACARENAELIGFGKTFTVEERDLFPEGTADLVLFNPPWIPEPPRTRIDRAIFDPKGEVLTRFLAGVRDHLAPGGEVWLIISDLAERLRLRPEGSLAKLFEANGLTVKWTRQTAPTHPKASDQQDPLHQARALERTTLYCLSA